MYGYHLSFVAGVRLLHVFVAGVGNRLLFGSRCTATACCLGADVQLPLVVLEPMYSYRLLFGSRCTATACCLGADVQLPLVVWEPMYSYRLLFWSRCTATACCLGADVQLPLVVLEPMYSYRLLFGSRYTATACCFGADVQLPLVCHSHCLATVSVSMPGGGLHCDVLSAAGPTPTYARRSSLPNQLPVSCGCLGQQEADRVSDRGYA